MQRVEGSPSYHSQAGKVVEVYKRGFHFPKNPVQGHAPPGDHLCQGRVMVLWVQAADLGSRQCLASENLEEYLEI